jgi:hypothetical protein
MNAVNKSVVVNAQVNVAPRSFKDKERTEAELNRTKFSADVFQKLGGHEFFHEGLLEEVRAIAIRSELARNSSEHYRVFTDASFLSGRAEMLKLMAQCFNAIMNPEITDERREAIIDKYQGRMEQWTFHFGKTIDSDNASWIGFKDDMTDVTQIGRDIRNACDEALRAGEQDKIDALLTGKIVKSKKVSAAQHDTFAKLLKNHDYYYAYSDCSRTWNRGHDQWLVIEKITQRHDHFARMWVALFDQEGSYTKAEDAIKKLRKGLK